MAEYQYPGVYVEEVPPLARPIAGVGTSTAGFIGVVMDDVQMPLKSGKQQGDVSGYFTVQPLIDATSKPFSEPQLITSWEQFKNNFGDFQRNVKVEFNNGTLVMDNGVPKVTPRTEDVDYLTYRQLQNAVYGFFNNGGTRCWVIRVGNETDLEDLATPLKKFEPIDDIAIVVVPGAIKKEQQIAIIDHCENTKDRTAILDGNTTGTTVDTIKNGTRDSNYAALYFPWIKVFDPISKTNISQPPSGHLAGVYARVDAERGVYKAPANEIVRGAVDLDFKLSSSDQAGLNPDGINVIRAFDGNFNIWGARTLGGDKNGEYKYISTRRYFNFLRKSIEQGTQFVVFEPNNIALWQRITRTVSDFLLRQWRDGALFGDTPKQAFYVKCDHATNPAEVREAGQVVTEIGLAIVKPAEFVIFRIQQTTG